MLTASEAGTPLLTHVSDETRRVYTCHWTQWTAWAEGGGIDPIPAAPAHVAAYLWDRARSGASISTVRLARATISAMHRDAGQPDPAADAVVKAAIGDIMQKGTHTPKQAAGITSRDLAAIQETAMVPRVGPSGRRESDAQARSRGLLDVALIAVMRDGMLGGSGAAALTWGDVHEQPDGSGRLLVQGED